MMARGQSSPRAWALMDEIRLTVQNMDPDTKAEQVLYEQGLERVHDLADARRDRLGEARESIPDILWVVLMVVLLDQRRAGEYPSARSKIWAIKVSGCHLVLVISGTSTGESPGSGDDRSPGWPCARPTAASARPASSVTLSDGDCLGRTRA